MISVPLSHRPQVMLPPVRGEDTDRGSAPSGPDAIAYIYSYVDVYDDWGPRHAHEEAAVAEAACRAGAEAADWDRWPVLRLPRRRMQNQAA
ncbi:hypothetical protein ACO0M4_34665 [Streptomyces sp. RGM 3693]|uniref:hypothetical protein n=1 Tax=Streptomyces sp. RGM 3693 TaxID=3413284 RepID=UPI003D2C5375